MKRLILLCLLLSSSACFAQLYESIQEKACDIFLNYRDNPKSNIEFEGLRTALFSEIDQAEAESTYKIAPAALDSLRDSFTQLESESKSISADSAMFLFNRWYLQFSNIFYDYGRDKFLTLPGTKIILFSTSMSCWCTLQMCKDQTIDIMNFVKENGDKYDYWIIDAYEHNDLQIKYEAWFTPSVLVFNADNTLLYKIEYDEKMIDKLKDYQKAGI